MQLVTYTHEGRRRVGQVIDGKIYAAAWTDPLDQIIRRGIRPSLTSDHIPVEEAILEAPLRPGKIIAIGRNYAEHAEELGNDVPPAPLIFTKFTSSIMGTGGVITWRESITQQVDWEGELAVVIGKRAREVDEHEAMRHVFGYTIANDVTARDIQSSESQWIRAKSLDTFCPLGPCVVTADAIGDPQNLSIQTLVNDEVMQDGSTAMMINSIAQLVSYCSFMFTLDPGDMILTGTPAGVGKGMNPPRFLQDGDTVTVRIEGIGTLTNTCQILP